MLEHLTADRDALQFLFTPMAGNTCLAWSLVWDYIQAEGEPVYKYTGHTEQQRMLDVAALAGPDQEGTLHGGWTPRTSSSTIWTAPASRQRTSGGF